MPGVSHAIGHLYVVRWAAMTVADIDDLAVKLRALYVATKRPVIYIAIQDDDYIEPTQEVKEAVRRGFPRLAEVLKYDYLVITAQGVRGSLMRSFLRAVLTAGKVAGVKNVEKVVVMNTVEDVLEREKLDLPASPASILDELRARGVLGAGGKGVPSLARD